MGEDGHTASLFPGHQLLNETVRWVAPIFDSPKPPPERITLTLPVLNHARHVAFVITGAGKAEVLPQAIGAHTIPAGLVQPVDGTLDWFVDEAAAANLPR
jgi:6-phosphogluconolactonase